MGRYDWCRNTTWSPQIEDAFFAKLARAREKSQYLRIQASAISDKYPDVALRLLDQFFALGDNFDMAQACKDRAEALKSMGRIDEAIASYDAALVAEARRPIVLTQTYVDLPLFIASEKLRGRYSDALEILKKNENRLMFPNEFFRWHAAHALIYSDLGNAETASVHAQRALEAAQRDDSGFRNHPSVGLVGHKHLALRKSLEGISAGTEPRKPGR